MSETKNGNSATEIEAEIKRLKTEKTQAMDIDEEYIEKVDLTTFHSDDYVDCLANISTDPEV